MSIRKPKTQVIERDGRAYPPRLSALLGRQAPERLFVMGNLDLLNRHSISFCGARNASEKGIEAAALCATTAVGRNFVIVSGNARGVDRATHRAALAHRGTTILVLPEGLDHFRIAAELREVWDWDRVLVLSQFEPKTVWQSYHAMTRNKVIMGLCASKFHSLLSIMVLMRQWRPGIAFSSAAALDHSRNHAKQASQISKRC